LITLKFQERQNYTKFAFGILGSARKARNLQTMKFLIEPWPWYVTGPLIGITVPILLLMGNKKLGVSSTLRQICAALVPAAGRVFDWKKNTWNLYFVGGVLIGGYLAGMVFANPDPVAVFRHPQSSGFTPR
jgi:Sulphur transport